MEASFNNEVFILKETIVRQTSEFNSNMDEQETVVVNLGVNIKTLEKNMHTLGSTIKRSKLYDKDMVENVISRESELIEPKDILDMCMNRSIVHHYKMQDALKNTVST